MSCGAIVVTIAGMDAYKNLALILRLGARFSPQARHPLLVEGKALGFAPP